MDVDPKVTEMNGCDRSPETVLARLWNKVTPDMRFVFLSTFIMGLITHLFVFTNKFINGDELLYFYDNKGMQMGRWFCWLSTQIISDNYSMPWVNGLVSLVFISISTCLIVSILDIRSRLNMLLVGGLMVTFLVVGCTFSYMFASAAYFLSLLLTIWGVWLTRRYRWGFVWGGVLLVFSLGIYQAYICMAIALFAVCILKEMLEGDTDNRTLLIYIGKYLAYGIIGVVGYYLILQFVFLFTGNTLTDYQGASDVTTSSFLQMNLLVVTVKDFVKFFFYWGCGLLGYVSWLFRIANLLIFALVVAYVIKLCMTRQRRDRNYFQLVLTVVIMLTLPLWINCIRLSTASFVHYIMVYAYVMPYILLVTLTEMVNREERSRVDRKKSFMVGRWLSFGCLLTIIYVGYLTTNEFYLQLHLMYEQSYAFTNRVIDRLEQMDGIDLDRTPVVMLNVPEPDTKKPQPMVKDWQYIKNYRSDSAFKALINFDSSFAFYKSEHFRRMSKDYFQKNFIAPPESLSDGLLNKTQEVQDMPYFPASGSIREVNGVIVVKIHHVQFPL